MEIHQEDEASASAISSTHAVDTLINPRNIPCTRSPLELGNPVDDNSPKVQFTNNDIRVHLMVGDVSLFSSISMMSPS